MNQRHLQTIYENEEDRQLARILSTLVWVTWVAYLFAFFTAIYNNDWKLIVATLTGSVFLIASLVLLGRGHLHASNLIVVLSTLGTVTIIATVGQGIRDLAIVAFPIIFIFAGLTLNRALFRLCVGLALAAVCWLVFGEIYGWFVTRPFEGEMANWLYLIGTVIILLLAALAVDLLTTNMRKSLELAQYEIAQRKQAEEQLRYQSTHDVLTGVYNRTFFETEFARFEHSRDNPISIIMADVDNLKVANDTLGHAVGDELLRNATNILRTVFRESDVLARIGGDEFAVLLPTTDSVSAEQMLVRVQERLAKHNAEHADLPPVQLSLGTATAEKNNLTEVFTLADQRMYANKAARKANANHSSAS